MIFTNALYARLLGDAQMAALFAPEAEIAAMIRVERALARAQGRIGVIPAEAGEAIDRQLSTVELDALELAEGTLIAGVPVPPFVSALRNRLSPDAAHWLHWGATTHDIMDCALLLRLREGFDLLDQRLSQLIARLADLADAHVETPMVGRTRTQIATPISFGLRLAYWLQGILDQRDRLQAVRKACGKVQFGGASGANSATAPHGMKIIEALAQEMDLEPAVPWHTNRTFAPDVTNWCAALSGAFGRIGGDVLLMARREIAEVKLAGGGGSSTMPNKVNPVAAEAIVALARYAATLPTSAQLSVAHHEDRDSTAWMLEWIAIPQAMICAAAASNHLLSLLDGLKPDADAMAANLNLDGGAAMAEAASFVLAGHLPRAEAQAKVKEAARISRDTRTSLIDTLETLVEIDGLSDQIRRTSQSGSGHEIIAAILARARAVD